ncbi:PAS domain S-box protein [Effusibacillus dendaii]|uniref:histidine kinase n=1 Tax=Effusibacillus dendaii TaxID=2743772 RepID=A0A7I8DJH5_9BACL|nr:PAS domain S-box protein [Effusibacillus dendaii]BCJ88001.1 hypothetical protein skT53_29860 [Effusibacillus dendaii]
MRKEAWYITEAKQKCAVQGLDPQSVPSYGIVSVDEFREKSENFREILTVTDFFIKKVLEQMEGTPLVVVFSDEQGTVLGLAGDESITHMINRLGIRKGIQLREELSGVNSAGLALRYQRPIELVGEDHFHECLRNVVCCSVVLRDLETDRLLGALTIMTTIEHQTPLLLTMLCTVADSIERELLLRKQNDRLHVLFELNPDIIFSIDLDGNFVSVNPAFTKITGYLPEEVVNRPGVSIVAPGQRKMAKEYFQKVMQGGSQTVEVTVLHRSGDRIEVKIRALPILQDGRINGVYGVATDVTERKRSEELLRKHEMMSFIGELAAGVAHEIRNPLTAIRGFVQLMQSMGSEYHKYHEIMLSELDRINSIVGELLMLAKPQATRFEKRDLGTILDNITILLNAQAILHNVQIVTEMEADLPLVRCEENQIKQVVINLLKNGIESMPNGGQIVVQICRHGDDQVRIRFIDQGQGISEERLAKLGEPFYTTKDKGTGLGLMVSFKIVENHRGQIKFQSKINQGTIVDVFLPID